METYDKRSDDVVGLKTGYGERLERMNIECLGPTGNSDFLVDYSYSKIFKLCREKPNSAWHRFATQ